MSFTSWLFIAYLSLFWITMDSGSDSLSLWGPVEGLVAHLPPNLLSIHECGVAIRFMCFLGPLA